MNKKRPVNLQLNTIRFPLTAIVSILHRISGVLLFLFIPFVLWLLQTSLHSQLSFDTLASVFSSPWVKLITWALLSALIYHFVAGIKHLLMDLGIGEESASSRCFALAVMIVSIVLILLVGVWLW